MKSLNQVLRVLLISLSIFLIIFSEFITMIASISISAMIIVMIALWIVFAIFLFLLIGIAKPRGITNGIGGILILIGLTWHIMIGLNGYEQMLISFFNIYVIPIVLVIAGAINLVQDIISKSHTANMITSNNKAINLSLPIIYSMVLYPLMHIPRWTLSYIDQGIAIPYLEGHFLYTSIAVIVLFLVAIGLLALAIIFKFDKNYICSAAISVISSLSLCVCYFVLPSLFWMGCNPFLISITIICQVLTVPMTQIKTKKSNK